MTFFFVGYSVPQTIKALEAGDDDVVMSHDHDGGVILLGQSCEQLHDDQRAFAV